MHPAWFYMLRDAGGSLWGTLVFALALLTPGYCAGQCLNLCSFRSRGLREQLAWSVVLSFGAGTLPLVGIVWLVGIPVAEFVLVFTGALALILFFRRRPPVDIEHKETSAVALAAAAWICVVIVSLIDLGIGSHLWMSVTSYDHSLRTAFVDAVMRTGVVPVNPVYWPGHDAPMRYYYFWYVTCAVVAKLAHISARQSLVASCVWPMFGIAAMLALYGRYLLEWREAQLRRGWMLSVALLSVTGLDLLVILFSRLGGIPIYGDMEWWSIDQVTSWVDTFFWVPHHAAALICCLLSLLLIWRGSRESRLGERMKLATIAGLSFAGAFGLSTYIAIATALVLGAWLVRQLFYPGRLRSVSTVAASAILASLLLIPYLAQLLHSSGTTSKPAHMLAFGIRQILDPALLLDLRPLRQVQIQHPFVTTQVAALLLLPLGYFVELGFFALVLVFVCRKWRSLAEGEKVLFFWMLSGLAAASLLRSQVIGTNDYGIRSILLVQFFLLLFGAAVFERSSGWLRKTLLILACIGVCGTAYQVVMLRAFLPWHEIHGDRDMRDLAERNYVLRDAYEALDKSIPQSSRLQYDISRGSYFLYSDLLNANHQVITTEQNCNTSFGGEPSACAAIQEIVGQLFPVKGEEEPAARRAAALCGSLGAQYLVASRWDSVWQNPDGWVWHLPLVVERPSIRIVACRDLGRPPSR